jgi:hypothetical protein
VLVQRQAAFADLAPGSVDGIFGTVENPPPSRPAGRGDLVDVVVEGAIELVLDDGSHLLPGRRLRRHDGRLITRGGRARRSA